MPAAAIEKISAGMKENLKTVMDEKTCVSAQHIDVTVGKVDQPDYTVNHGIPQSNERINAAQGNTVN